MEPSTMSQSTDRAATEQTLTSLIDEAAQATQVLPPYERCVELNEGLRNAISGLCEQVEQQAGEHPVRSRDWYRLTGLLEQADMILGAGMGEGLMSAALHVAALGRQARLMRDGIADGV